MRNANKYCTTLTVDQHRQSRHDISTILAGFRDFVDQSHRHRHLLEIFSATVFPLSVSVFFVYLLKREIKKLQPRILMLHEHILQILDRFLLHQCTCNAGVGI